MAIIFGYEGKAEKIEKQIKKFDDKVNLIDDSGLSMKMKANIYQKIIENFENLNRMIEIKLLESGNLDKKGRIYQIEFLKYESQFRSAKTFSEIVSTKMQYNYMKCQLVKKYCDGVMCGEINDVDVLNLIKNINNILNNCFDLDVNYNYVNCYDECENLYDYCINKIGEINRIIQFYATKRENIENSDLTFSAFANRDAVNKHKKRK